MEIMRESGTEEHEADLGKLAEMARLAIGGRSLREFAKLSDLSEGFLSRLTSGKLTSAPTRRTLSKIACPESRPQNGITFGALMRTAGYAYEEPEIDGKAKGLLADEIPVPAKVKTSSFPLYLVASVLEESGQLGPAYEAKTMRDFFKITPRLDKEIVGIPVFCKKKDVEEEISTALWNLSVAMLTVGAKKAEAFFVILTNQPEFYETFDADPVHGIGGELYIALTNDYERFTKQRPVRTVGDETLKKNGNEATYNLVSHTENHNNVE